MESLIRRGTLTCTRFPDDLRQHINTYLGSGRAGACFDVWGLMHNGMNGPLQSGGNTALSHADYYSFAPFGMDDFAPLGRLVFMQEPQQKPMDWQQVFTPWQGSLRTQVNMPGYSYVMEAAFDPWQRDRLCLRVQYDNPNASMPAICYVPDEAPLRSEGQRAANRFVKVTMPGPSQVLIRQATTAVACDVLLHVIPESGPLPQLAIQGNRVVITVPRGTGCFGIVMAMGSASRHEELAAAIATCTSPAQTLQSIATGWAQRFGDAMVDLPDDRVQGLFVRGLYGILASYGPDVRCQAPPMGFSSNCWQRPFPQDLSFIHPVLLRLGHLDIAKAWVDFYYNTMGQMQEYTRRIFKKPGIHWAWEYPKDCRPFLLGAQPGEPNWYQYQLHNAAYPARMAFDTSFYIRDDNWQRQVAWPIICESTRFLVSGLNKTPRGTWRHDISPSSGQDEYGIPGSDNYICALYATRYCLITAITFAEQHHLSDPDLTHWKQVLKDGLAFNELYDPQLKIYGTCSTSPAPSVIGKEKHPVQLMPLTFLPQDCDEPAIEAYRRRHELCIHSDRKLYFGWTLNDMQLASAHMGDGDAMLDEVESMLNAGLVDQQWLQLYESSPSLMTQPLNIVHYQTNVGLFLQAVCDAFVCDCFDKPEYRKALPGKWAHAHCYNLRDRWGNRLSF